jgi:ribose-phosphate pyrophosphokinase
VFDEAYEMGYFGKLVTTNLTYQPEELKDREWFESADMSKYAAMIIDFINHDISLSNMSTSTEKIHKILEKINRNEQSEFEQMQLEQTEF